ncbi:hypothetical protein CDL15_Pgr011191 [Punica granatum]|uniref:Uncharacterized protein n=1 Tax=Punica granatum TaxID=22663 RepID=A0A218WDW2_PUNGR|nr:hypothetical protein CDL15_Pgr011191 [Punica granatum]PKH63929.1 hypothetical protein CRG98_050210 [Punica granatum]
MVWSSDRFPSNQPNPKNNGKLVEPSSAKATISSKLKEPIEEVGIESRVEISSDANNFTGVGHDEAQRPSTPTCEPKERSQNEEAAAAKQLEDEWPELSIENLAKTKGKCKQRMGVQKKFSSSATTGDCSEPRVEQEAEVPLRPENIANGNEDNRRDPTRPRKEKELLLHKGIPYRLCYD